MRITADMDGGAIEERESGASPVLALGIRGDRDAPFRQWFCFRVEDAAGEPLSFALENAGEATYAEAFDGYRVCASYEGERWFRVPTTWDGSTLRFDHTPDEPAVTYAYFAPYPRARREALLARAAEVPGVRVEVLGETVEGRPLAMVVVGDDEGDDERLRVWVIARQHPGETMAEWLAEGLLERLLDPDDEVARELRRRTTFHLVPCMNPDGGVLGNHRTNAAGEDLNRTWEDPSPETAPEVFLVRRAMEERGVDLFLDVHGDERHPCCFLAGCEGNPGYGARLRFLENLFEQVLLAQSPDFQDAEGYERDAPGQADLRVAGNWVGERFDCLAYTLEMPFKDNARAPDPWLGWSPDRSRALGAAVLATIGACLPALRADLDLGEAWAAEGEGEHDPDAGGDPRGDDDQGGDPADGEG